MTCENTHQSGGKAMSHDEAAALGRRLLLELRRHGANRELRIEWQGRDIIVSSDHLRSILDQKLRCLSDDLVRW